MRWKRLNWEVQQSFALTYVIAVNQSNIFMDRASYYYQASVASHSFTLCSICGVAPHPRSLSLRRGRPPFVFSGTFVLTNEIETIDHSTHLKFSTVLAFIMLTIIINFRQMRFSRKWYYQTKIAGIQIVFIEHNNISSSYFRTIQTSKF